MYRWNRRPRGWIGVVANVWIVVTAIASVGVQCTPQTPTFTGTDMSHNWRAWSEDVRGDINSYASSCNGEFAVAERRTALLPQATLADRRKARDGFVRRKTVENSRAIGRPE